MIYETIESYFRITKWKITLLLIVVSFIVLSFGLEKVNESKLKKFNLIRKDYKFALIENNFNKLKVKKNLWIYIINNKENYFSTKTIDLRLKDKLKETDVYRFSRNDSVVKVDRVLSIDFPYKDVSKLSFYSEITFSDDNEVFLFKKLELLSLFEKDSIIQYYIGQ